MVGKSVHISANALRSISSLKSRETPPLIGLLVSLSNNPDRIPIIRQAGTYHPLLNANDTRAAAYGYSSAITHQIPNLGKEPRCGGLCGGPRTKGRKGIHTKLVLVQQRGIWQLAYTSLKDLQVSPEQTINLGIAQRRNQVVACSRMRIAVMADSNGLLSNRVVVEVTAHTLESLKVVQRVLVNVAVSAIAGSTASARRLDAALDIGAARAGARDECTA